MSGAGDPELAEALRQSAAAHAQRAQLARERAGGLSMPLAPPSESKCDVDEAMRMAIAASLAESEREAQRAEQQHNAERALQAALAQSANEEEQRRAQEQAAKQACARAQAEHEAEMQRRQELDAALAAALDESRRAAAEQEREAAARQQQLEAALAASRAAAEEEKRRALQEQEQQALLSAAIAASRAEQERQQAEAEAFAASLAQAMQLSQEDHERYLAERGQRSNNEDEFWADVCASSSSSTHSSASIPQEKEEEDDTYLRALQLLGQEQTNPPHSALASTSAEAPSIPDPDAGPSSHVPVSQSLPELPPPDEELPPYSAEPPRCDPSSSAPSLSIGAVAPAAPSPRPLPPTPSSRSSTSTSISTIPHLPQPPLPQPPLPPTPETSASKRRAPPPPPKRYPAIPIDTTAVQSAPTLHAPSEETSGDTTPTGPSRSQTVAHPRREAPSRIQRAHTEHAPRPSRPPPPPPPAKTERRKPPPVPKSAPAAPVAGIPDPLASPPATSPTSAPPAPNSVSIDPNSEAQAEESELPPPEERTGDSTSAKGSSADHLKTKEAKTLADKSQADKGSESCAPLWRSLPGLEWGWARAPFDEHLSLAPPEPEAATLAFPGVEPGSSGGTGEWFPACIPLLPDPRFAPANAKRKGSDEGAFFVLRAQSWESLLHALAWLGNTVIDLSPSASVPRKGAALRIDVEFLTPTRAGINPESARARLSAPRFGLAPHGTPGHGKRKATPVGPSVGICLSVLPPAAHAQTANPTALARHAAGYFRAQQGELDMRAWRADHERKLITLPPRSSVYGNVLHPLMEGKAPKSLLPVPLRLSQLALALHGKRAESATALPHPVQAGYRHWTDRTAPRDLDGAIRAHGKRLDQWHEARQDSQTQSKNSSTYSLHHSTSSVNVDIGDDAAIVGGMTDRIWAARRRVHDRVRQAVQRRRDPGVYDEQLTNWVTPFPPPDSAEYPHEDARS